MRSSISHQFQILAQRIGISVSPHQIEQIGQFLELLLLWNQKVNLTGARSIEDLLNDHLPDSFSMAKIIPSDFNVVDIGSGGGLPGIPFAILRPESKILLVEPRAKRTAFLLQACRQLKLSHVTVLRGRLEEIQPQNHVYLSSKATFDPQTWINLSISLCVADSRVLAFLGRETNPNELTPTPFQKFHYLTGNNVPRCLAIFGPSA